VQNDALLAHVRFIRVYAQTDVVRRQQRPNVLKFSVSSLTWANPCSFAPVAVRERNAYYWRRQRLRSNSQQMPLKTALPLASQSPPRIKTTQNNAIDRFARPLA